MRARQAKKIIKNAVHGRRPPTRRVVRALRTVWHRSHHENGKRMGGSLFNFQVNLVAQVITGKIKVNPYGVIINDPR